MKKYIVTLTAEERQDLLDLIAAGKARVVVTTAIAREMVGFIWAIARQVQLQPTG